MVLRPRLVHVLLRTVGALPGETTTLGSRVWYGAPCYMWRFLHEVQGEPATTLLVVVAGCRPSVPLLEQEFQVAEGFVRDDEL